jgi:hypothetical protein
MSSAWVFIGFPERFLVFQHFHISASAVLTPCPNRTTTGKRCGQTGPSIEYVRLPGACARRGGTRAPFCRPTGLFDQTVDHPGPLWGSSVNRSDSRCPMVLIAQTLAGSEPPDAALEGFDAEQRIIERGSSGHRAMSQRRVRPCAAHPQPAR